MYLNGSIQGLKRAYLRQQMEEIVAFAGLERFIDLPVRTYSSGMYMRLGFAIAAHVDADVLLLDEVFAVGDEEFQRRCFGKIFEFKQRGGTIVFVSHDASAVERLCDRAVLLREGRVEFDGHTHEALSRYHRLLAEERDPAERGAGLSEWGSGEVRIAEAILLGPNREERRQFLVGEPFAVRLHVAAERPVAPPILSYELRDDSGVLVAAGSEDMSTLGWGDGAGTRVLCFDVKRLPLSEGRFHLHFGLTDARGEHLYHWLDDALRFVVYSGGGERGVVRLEGTWSVQESAFAAKR